MVRALAAGITRRGALGILAGLAGLEWADSEAAKRRKRKGAAHKGRQAKKGRQQKGRQKKRQAQARAEAKEDKVTICHRTGSEKNPFVEIEVAPSAVPAHEAHGDTIDPDFENDPENCGGCGISCDDDNECTTDTCVEGDCVNEEIDCDDDNECTDDSCDPAIGCVNTPVPGRSCNDNNACTQDDRCRADGTCQGTAIDCDDGNACTADSCNPATGCVHTTINCDDGIACTDDSCDPARGCVHRDNCPRGQSCNRQTGECEEQGEQCGVDACAPETEFCCFGPPVPECCSIPNEEFCTQFGCETAP